MKKVELRNVFLLVTIETKQSGDLLFLLWLVF